LAIDAAPSLLIPDLIVTAEALGRCPILVFLALAGVSSFDALVADRAGLLRRAVIKLGEASAAVFKPGGEVVVRACLLGAGGFFPEASAPFVSPVAFLLREALQPVAVILGQEAAA